MTYIKHIFFCLVLIALVFGLNTPVFAHLSDTLWLSDYIRSHGITGHLTIFAVSFLFVCLGGPRQAIAALYGYLYGLVIGLNVTLLACILAATVNYLAANTLLTDTLYRFFPIKMAKFQVFARQAPFLKILMLRLFPVGSNLLTNLLSGCVGVPFIAFALASLVGYLPQTIIFSLIGNGISAANNAMIYTSIILSTISVALTGVIYRDHIKQRMTPLNMDIPHER